MFDSMREHYDSLASQWEINHERFAGEEINDIYEEVEYCDFCGEPAAWVSEYGNYVCSAHVNEVSDPILISDTEV